MSKNNPCEITCIPSIHTQFRQCHCHLVFFLISLCVESVKRMNKLTVIGSMDPSKLRDLTKKRTIKKVETISPKKDKDKKNNGNGDDKKNSGDKEDKTEKKSKDIGNVYLQPLVTTALLKVPLHWDGCIQKIQKLVYKTKELLLKTVAMLPFEYRKYQMEENGWLSAMFTTVFILYVLL
ncbi:hypothetical protein DCAR_0311168 [Daucus carota subsp. sativus]|uniref:Uncharacterized protein n=1 Tax=Daucus carota subsp. sativus TaxID=79200 RepID=A0AAF0WP77_DAUCS|nr:hypothetical protein DCAR_0311168 [Daucus carota subsp. sativus]